METKKIEWNSVLEKNEVNLTGKLLRIIVGKKRNLTLLEQFIGIQERI